MTAGCDFSLLGPVEARVAGGVVSLGGRRQRALLALLLLEPGRPSSPDRLIEELWLGEPPDGAAATLRSYVSRLRRALGREMIVAQPGGYTLLAAPDRIDAHRFEHLLAEGRDALARGAAGLASERLHAALALWRGRALADVADGGLLAIEAGRLEEMRLTCIEERIDADLALAHHDALVPELHALAQAEPLRERFWRQLVLALYRSGRQAEALAAYRHARRLLIAELGIEPGEELRELERAILRQEVAPVTAGPARHNLPAPTTSFVGRVRELAEIEQRLREHRLVTLTGMGGSGKTRLALEAGRGQVEVWRDGIWLVDLTAVSDSELVTSAVAATLGAAGGPEEDLLEAIVAHVGTHELLLVLDNCEHLADACAVLAESILRRCPNVRILATSRVPLGVEGELDYLLDPLTVPDADAPFEQLEQAASVQLFLERAAAVRREDADAKALATVASICRELDGLPLAVELAAARAKSLSPADIADKLSDRFRFLRAWQRVANPRHRTLETTMDWSYDLLTADEQQLLRALSVFADGAELEAISAVDVGGDELDTLDLLGRLVDASLVRAELGKRTRYRLLETVRAYAGAKLGTGEEAARVRRRHAEYFLLLAESANLSVESLGKGAQRPELVVAEQHNLRAALDWAAGNDVELGLRLALALENFWIVHAVAEGERRYEQLLAQAEDVDLLLRARATRDYAACLDVQQQWAAARVNYERYGELSREAGDPAGAAHATFRLGVVAWQDGDLDHVRRLWEESLAVFGALGDRIGELQAIGNLGGLEWELGNRERAITMVERALEMGREAGWLWWEARALADLATMALEQGDVERAERTGRDYLTIATETESPQDVLHALALLARAAAVRGDGERALALWATVEATEDAPGRFGRFDRDGYAAAMPDGSLPPPLPLEQAVELALSD